MLGLLLLTILPMLYAWLPGGIDWLNNFRPAALAVLQGESPYTIPGYYNPPWTVLPLIPVAMLPLAWSRAVWFLVSLAGFALLVRRLTDQPISILLFLTSAPVFHCLYYGNIDWIAMLSLVTPAPLALVLASVKPQVGIGVIVYLLVESWRVGGPRGVARAVLPLMLLLGASFLVYGFWPHHIQELGAAFWSISPFPWLVPVGVLLLGWSVHKMEIRSGLAAGLCFAPYFALSSLSTLLVPLLERPKVLATAWAITWLGFILIRLLE